MILLQTVPTYINMADLKRRLQETIPGILGIHEFHVWQLAGDCVIASIHIV
jgi:zinc transporter 1